MEYLWPARKDRHRVIGDDDEDDLDDAKPERDYTIVPTRASLDSARSYTTSRQNSEATTPTGMTLAPPLRRLGASRSFTDLRSAVAENARSLSPTLQSAALPKTRSSENLRERVNTRNPDLLEVGRSKSRAGSLHEECTKSGDAAEMRTRSSQKTFILVRIARYTSVSFHASRIISYLFELQSLHLVLNIMKEDSFVCQDARIRTRDLEFRNQTWSVSCFLRLRPYPSKSDLFSVRRIRESIYSLRHELEGLGEDGVPSATRTSLTRCSRTHIENQMDCF